MTILEKWFLLHILYSAMMELNMYDSPAMLEGSLLNQVTTLTLLDSHTLISRLIHPTELFSPVATRAVAPPAVAFAFAVSVRQQLQSETLTSDMLMAF